MEGADRKWVDLLEKRRSSNDVLWLTLHNWSCQRFKDSEDRSYRTIRSAVYHDPEIQRILKESPAIRSRIESILEEMSHSWSLGAIRFVGYFVTKIMKSIYRHVWVQDHLDLSVDSFYFDPNRTSSLTQRISLISKESPILYMPTHRSYADFLIFSYMCFDLNLPLPAIAAGIDFLSLNQVASLLRSCGAFFIRRSFKNDEIYRQTFRAYIETQVLGGERPLEFFVEGTRSRSGKSLYPKTGLLSIALNLFLTGRLPDIVIIPISISYDRTLEEELYARELIAPTASPAAVPKPKETTAHLISGAKSILSQNFGDIHIRFAEPISTRELSYSFRGKDVRKEVRRHGENEAKHFVDFLAKKVISDQINHLALSAFTLFSLSVLASDKDDQMSSSDDEKENPHPRFLFINLKKVIADVDHLSSLMDERNVSFRIRKQNVDDAVQDSLDIHKNLVERRSDPNGSKVEWPSNSDVTVRVRMDGLSVIQLRHYASQTLQLLIDDCICCHSDSFDTYVRIKHLLVREFIFLDTDLEQKYLSTKRRISCLNSRIKSILVFHITFYLNAYLSLVIWLKSLVTVDATSHTCNSPSTNLNSLKALVREAQKELDLASDILENGLVFLSSRGVLTKHEDDGQNLVIEPHALNQMYQEIFSLTFPQFLPSPQPDMTPKSKL